MSHTLPWLNHDKVARDANAMMAEADDTAAKMCKALQDEHEKRAKYFKQGKVQKYALQDTVWVERHHKDVLSGPPWPSFSHLGCVSMCRQAAIG